MISGLNNSGIASAIRTAGQARATMDTMSRQIATGQRVASVKDDGASWVRASVLRSDQVQWEDRSQTLNRVEVGLKATQATLDEVRSRFDRLGELILSARTSAPGSSTRAALQAEWTTLATPSFSGGTNPAFDNLTGFSIDALGAGYRMNTTDPFFSGTRFAAYSNLDLFSQWTTMTGPVQLSTFNLLNATDSQLDQAATAVNTLRGRTGYTWLAQWDAENSADLQQVDRLKDMSEAASARLEGQIASLTDADLGKASAARSMAETRQQLALSTVRQAISTYGAFATGLLGNVQRTQRGITA